jgi:hypothetical protein
VAVPAAAPSSLQGTPPITVSDSVSTSETSEILHQPRVPRPKALVEQLADVSLATLGKDQLAADEPAALGGVHVAAGEVDIQQEGAMDRNDDPNRRSETTSGNRGGN